MENPAEFQLKKALRHIKKPRDSNLWTEHKLRTIASLPKEKQYESFKELNKLDLMNFPYTSEKSHLI